MLKLSPEHFQLGLQADNDAEVAAKVFTLILAVMNAADADSHAALRLRFIRMLLDKGNLLLTCLLFNASTDISEDP